MSTIGELIKASGVTTERLAELTGAAYDSMVNYRNGRRTPDAATTRGIADALESEAQRLRGLAKELRGLVKYQR